MIKNTQLFDKIYAGMLGGAIGDAMGGPVEGWDYRGIESTFGRLDKFIPYGDNHEPSFHGAFSSDLGVYTDDTRLKHVLCQAIIKTGDLPMVGDFAQACAEYYYSHPDDLHRGFMEEYYLSALYGEDKLIFGGQPTNGAIMMNSPLGFICPADPKTAFELAYKLAYITDGYAKYSSAILVAAIAAAMHPDATVDSVIRQALEAAAKHQRVEPLTRNWRWFSHVYGINEQLVETAIEIAARHHDVLEVRAEFYDKLLVSPLGSEAAQSLAVSLGMFYAAKGDFAETIIGGVNYGRDNDSYASIGGALAGAFQGTESIPKDWIDTILTANPEPDMVELSQELTRVAVSRYDYQAKVVEGIGRLV